MPAPALIYFAVRGIIGAIQRHREKIRLKRIKKEAIDMGPRLLSFLLPFVPVKYRTVGGVVLLSVGTVFQAIASPELLALLPHKYAAIGAMLQGWGVAAAALGIRFANQPAA